jgi:hypothetical protein
VPGCKRIARFRVMLYRFVPGPEATDRELILMLDPDCPIICLTCACREEVHFRATGSYLYARKRTASGIVVLRRIVGIPWFEGEDTWEESEEHF